MDLKATIATSYRNRLLLIAIAALLYAAWCIYDATIAYPDKIDARQAFEKVQTEHPETWRTDEWPKLAEANGWDPTKEPEKLDAWNIRTQWIQFAIVFPIGSYCLYSMLVWSRRYVGADGEKLYSHTGDEIRFDRITNIDATRWENKGIAIVNYDIGQGEKSLVIDDWKYTREPSDQIFDRLRENVDADKFVGLAEKTEAADASPEAEAAASETAETEEDAASTTRSA